MLIQYTHFLHLMPVDGLSFFAFGSHHHMFLSKIPKHPSLTVHNLLKYNNVHNFKISKVVSLAVFPDGKTCDKITEEKITPLSHLNTIVGYTALCHPLNLSNHYHC